MNILLLLPLWQFSCSNYTFLMVHPYLTDLQTLKSMCHHKVCELVALKQALKISHSTSIFWLHLNKKTSKRKNCKVMWGDDSEVSSKSQLTFMLLFFDANQALMIVLSSNVSRTSFFSPWVSKDTMIYVIFLVQPHQLSRCFVGIGVQTTLITVMCELYSMAVLYSMTDVLETHFCVWSSTVRHDCSVL